MTTKINLIKTSIQRVYQMIQLQKHSYTGATTIALKGEYFEQEAQGSFNECFGLNDVNTPKWLDNIEFEVMDVREDTNTFIAEVSIKAKSMPVNKGLEIIQSTDPAPLINVMAGMGWTHFCKVTGTGEYHIYFTRDKHV
jgi:hypothetical protein